MPFWKHRKQDAMNASDTRERSEADVSRERAHKTRKQVVEPLRDLAERNQFAAMIRASLFEGHERKP